MTTLAANTAMIDTFGRTTAGANPRYNPAFLAGDGILGWLGRSATVRSLFARKAERDLRRAMQRLAGTSAHLLDDVCRADSPAPAGAARQTALTPVARRSAQRPVVAVPTRTSGTAAPAARSTRGGAFALG